MRVHATSLPEVKVIEPRIFEDDRGFFLETWNSRAFAEAGIDHRFVQDNHSRSGAGVLRGIHYQIEQPQGKLVRVVRGRVFDIAVDLRRSSPDFGKWCGVELSEANNRMLWIPPGFGHGFLTLEDETDFIYKCTDHYAPQHERTILWSDPDLGIAWPLRPGERPSLSPKDAAAPLLREAETYA